MRPGARRGSCRRHREAASADAPWGAGCAPRSLLGLLAWSLALLPLRAARRPGLGGAGPAPQPPATAEPRPGAATELALRWTPSRLVEWRGCATGSPAAVSTETQRGDSDEDMLSEPLDSDRRSVEGAEEGPREIAAADACTAPTLLHYCHEWSRGVHHPLTKGIAVALSQLRTAAEDSLDLFSHQDGEVVFAGAALAKRSMPRWLELCRTLRKSLGALASHNGVRESPTSRSLFLCFHSLRKVCLSVRDSIAQLLDATSAGSTVGILMQVVSAASSVLPGFIERYASFCASSGHSWRLCVAAIRSSRVVDSAVLNAQRELLAFYSRHSNCSGDPDQKYCLEVASVMESTCTAGQLPCSNALVERTWAQLCSEWLRSSNLGLPLPPKSCEGNVLAGQLRSLLNSEELRSGVDDLRECLVTLVRLVPVVAHALLAKAVALQPHMISGGFVNGRYADAWLGRVQRLRFPCRDVRVPEQLDPRLQALQGCLPYLDRMWLAATAGERPWSPVDVARRLSALAAWSPDVRHSVIARGRRAKPWLLRGLCSASAPEACFAILEGSARNAPLEGWAISVLMTAFGEWWEHQVSESVRLIDAVTLRCASAPFSRLFRDKCSEWLGRFPLQGPAFVNAWQDDV